MKNIILLIVAVSLLTFGTTAAHAADLTINITGLKSDKGMVRVALKDGAEGFPNKRKPVAVKTIKIVNGKATVVFTDLKPKKYAVNLFHDENDNKKLDTNLFGIPKEGFGFSNNAKGSFGPPKFAAAAFAMGENDREISISINY